MSAQSLLDVSDALRVDGYFACVTLPVRTTRDAAQVQFLDHLEAALCISGLGRVTAHSFALKPSGCEVLRISLSLATDAPQALEVIGMLLDGLGAPSGSTIGHAECPNLIAFGGKPSSGSVLRLDHIMACSEARNAGRQIACTHTTEAQRTRWLH